VSAPALLAPDEQTPTAGSARPIGPDMAQLWRRFPPRSPAASWPMTEQARGVLLARLLTTPFTIEDAPAARARRRLGLARLLDWLVEHPGDTWQQRWLVSGGDAAGNAQWWRPLLAWARPRNPRAGVSTSSNLRVCALLLIGADVIRPSLDWVLTPRAPQNLVAIMARARDPDGFAELSALCAATPAGRTMKTAALRRAATILAVKGGTLREITVGDCLELSLAIDGRSLRANKAMGFYQLLHEMSVFPPDAPSTFRAFGTTGQLSPAQLIDRYAITCRPVRDVLVAYLAERQPMLDHTTLRDLAFSLGGLFWRDLERHHPGIRSLHLAPEVAAAWKQRMLIKTRQVVGPDGQTSEVRERRTGGLHNLAAVRAFYLDIAQWAMEDPPRWAPWAAPCPIRAEDLARQKEIRSRKSRTDQRTRERLPVLPTLLERVSDMRTTTAARLATARTSAAAGPAHIWDTDPATGRRRDLSGEEDRAFWTWAAVETLRHTGIRIEELTELSHHSLIQYALPGTGEPVPLLQIAPSKTDTERLLVISPELADVLAAAISRIRGRDGALGCVASYDSHERVWNPPMPLLFQRRFGIEHRAIPAATLREWISRALDGSNVTDAAGQSLRFTPHDFRRMFITDAVLHGMPPHIAQLVAGHRDINTTMGYKAVYPDEVINGHRAFIARRRALRPSAEYRVPTEQEWEEFLGHFERRKLSLGTCGRSYATPCIHEHACVRCPLLRPDPAQRLRLVEIRDNLHARIAEARREGWLGEADGLQISLNGARQKLAQLDQLRANETSTQLGMPTFTQIAGRSIGGATVDAPN
jgi:integrase